MMPPLLVLAHHLGPARLIALLLDGEEYESFPIFNWESDENLEETMEPKKKYLIENRTEFRNDRRVWNAR